MLNLVGLKDNLMHVATLSRPYLSSGMGKVDLKAGYKKFLSHSQPKVPQSEKADLNFLYRINEINELLELFEEKSALDDFNEIFDPSAESDQLFNLQRVQEAITKMHELDSEFHDLMHLVINTIFTAPSALAGGGSTSAAIGCIWVNLRRHWQIEDVLEFLVHETTHNLVFLDELCHGHYTDYSQLSNQENFAWSAILNKLRPIDKVFHSIIVSTEVLLFRQNRIGHPKRTCLHPPSPIMLEQALYSIEYLNQNQNLQNMLSERAKYLMEACSQALRTIEIPTLTESVCCV